MWNTKLTKIEMQLQLAITISYIFLIHILTSFVTLIPVQIASKLLFIVVKLKGWQQCRLAFIVTLLLHLPLRLPLSRRGARHGFYGTGRPELMKTS